MKLVKANSDLVVRWIDYTILAILCVFCFAYIRYSGRSFAEISVQFAFLNFPVFIGEFVLAACLILFIFRMILAEERFQKWHLWVLTFFIFVIIKALWGYAHWGPLALRDAAMFYYLSFAVIGFVCFRREFFNKWIILLIYAAVLGLGFDAQFNEYWLMPRILLGSLLAYHFPNRWVGALMALAIVSSTPFKLFLETSRSVILGNFFSVVVFIMLCSVFIRRKDRPRFVMIALFFGLLLGAYIFHFSGNKAAQGLLAFKQLNGFQQEMETVIDNRKASFKPREVDTVMLYSPNQIPVATVDSESLNATAASPSPNSQSTAADASSTRGMKLGNSVFRILIWKDAIDNMGRERKLLGIDFGKPFRSENIEIIRAAVDEWKRDGWIAMHNSYLDFIYRSGLVGVLLLIVLAGLYLYVLRTFLMTKSLAGILLCSSMVVPFLAANFAVTLEVPYNAIPIWSLFGMTLGFAAYKLNTSKYNPSPSDSNHADPHCS